MRAGDGSTKHLEKPVSLPGEIALDQEGLYELGREQPADIIVPVPTVSTRHAMLRVGAPHVPARGAPRPAAGTWAGLPWDRGLVRLQAGRECAAAKAPCGHRVSKPECVC